MNIRFYIDPETELPHIYRHEVDESEVEDALSRPGEDRPGYEGTRVASVEHEPEGTYGLFTFLTRSQIASSLLQHTS